MLKKFRRFVLKGCCLLLTAALLTGSVPLTSYAKKTTQQQIKDKEEERENLENQKEQNEEELEILKGEHKNLKEELQDLNAQLTAVSENLANLEQQIRDKEAEIAQTQADLDEAKKKENWQYDCMEKRIQAAYELGSKDIISIIFGAGSLSSILNVATYLESLISYDNRMLDSIIENREHIEAEEERLEDEKLELNILRIQAEAEQSKVNDLIEETSKAMAKYADQIEEAEREAKEYEAQLKKAEEDLETLKKKLQEEIRLSQLAANATWRNISDVTFAEGDLKLLANIIYCEAGGEPYAGQLAVGAVVMNRVLSSKFPDTIVGVVYQKNQFSPVKSGRLELALSVDKATPSCYQAAQEAMTGATNVGNCLFFRTPIPGLTGINIGGHVFY